jgi:hypothetical protein
MTNEDRQIFASACMEVETNIAKELTDGKITDDECLYRLLSIILEYKKRTLSDNPYQE